MRWERRRGKPPLVPVQLWSPEEVEPCLVFRDTCVNENEAIYAGRGHERQEFRMLKAIESVDIVKDRTEVVSGSRKSMMGELKRLWVGAKEVFKSCRAERLPIGDRVHWNRRRWVVWREGVRYTQARGEGSEYRGRCT